MGLILMDKQVGGYMEEYCDICGEKLLPTPWKRTRCGKCTTRYGTGKAGGGVKESISIFGEFLQLIGAIMYVIGFFLFCLAIALFLGWI